MAEGGAAAGVKRGWVVRLDGRRRVDVYTPDGKKESLGPGKLLLAPGILANPVPVEAMYDAQVARDTVRRNVLSREGVASLVELTERGKAAGRAEGEASARTALLEVYNARFGIPPQPLARMLAGYDTTTLHSLFAVFATREAEEMAIVTDSATGGSHGP